MHLCVVCGSGVVGGQRTCGWCGGGEGGVSMLVLWVLWCCGSGTMLAWWFVLCTAVCGAGRCADSCVALGAWELYCCSTALHWNLY